MTSELLVNVDSRGDAAAWDEEVTRYANGSFVTAVLSNNLHEVHGYNRLAAMARGTVLVVLQDDDMPPLQCSWASYVLRLFQQHPRLGALGARRCCHRRGRRQRQRGRAYLERALPTGMRAGNFWHPHDVMDDVFRPPGGQRHNGENWEACVEGQSYHESIFRRAAHGTRARAARACG